MPECVCETVCTCQLTDGAARAKKAKEQEEQNVRPV